MGVNNHDVDDAFKAVSKEAALHSANVLHTKLTSVPTGRSDGVRQHLCDQLFQQSLYDNGSAAAAAHAPPPLASPSVLAVDLASAAKQVMLFRRHLPSVTLHYALKSFPDMMVMVMLARLGVSFDCASSREIEMAIHALKHASSSPSSPSPSLPLQSSPSSPPSPPSPSPSSQNSTSATTNTNNSTTTSTATATSTDHQEENHRDKLDREEWNRRIIFANPVKRISDLKYASKVGVLRVTVDSIEEIKKLGRICPHAEAILRIVTDDSSSHIPLSVKFGARLTVVSDILQQAQQLGVQVVGVAFHVGSGAQSVQPFTKALHDARKVFDMARETFGIVMNVLDVGGGFPAYDGQASVTFAEIAQCITIHVEQLFKDWPDLHVLAEPGRFICGSAAMAAIRIENRLCPDNDDGRVAYVLADGIFGLFRDAWMFGDRYIPQVLVRASKWYENDGGFDVYFDSHQQQKQGPEPQEKQPQQLEQKQQPEQDQQPEQKKPEQKQPKQEQPEQEQPEQEQPEQEQPEQEQPEQVQPEQEQLEQEQLEQEQLEQEQLEQEQQQVQQEQIQLQKQCVEPKTVDQLAQSSHNRAEAQLDHDPNQQPVDVLERSESTDSHSDDLTKVIPDENGTEACDLFGVSMEIGDVITRDVHLPQLNRGDWVIFDSMGSYTSCLSTKRTDLPQAQFIYLFCEGEL